MPTINSMVQKNNLIANISHRYFKLDMEAAEKSVLVNAPLKTNAELLKSDFGGQPALTTLVENYSAEKADFQTQMQNRLESLQESTDKLKDSVQEEENIPESSEKETASTEEKGSALKTLGNFAAHNIPPRAKILQFQPKTERHNEDADKRIAEQATKIREENLKSAKAAKRDDFDDFAKNYLVADKKNDKQDNLKVEESENSKISNVKNFVRNYNSVVSHLNDNREMSNKISALASNFSGDEDLNVSLKEIGISVNSLGELFVNEKTLTDALENNPEEVGILLGMDGLTGQLDRIVNLANYQSENLFPTLEKYTGDEEFESWEHLYSAQTNNTADYAQKKAGNILNLFT